MSYLIDAAGERLEVADNDLLDFGSAATLTFMCWVKVTAWDAIQFMIRKNGNYELSWRTTTYAGYWWRDSPAEISTVESTTPASVNAWVHFAHTISGNISQKLFLNGVVIDSAEFSFAAGGRVVTNTLFFGNEENGTNFLKGKIAEPSIHTAVLSDAEVALAAGGKSAQQIQAGSLRAYWKLKDDANDSSGNGLHASVLGGATLDADHPPIDYGARPTFIPYQVHRRP